jgi:two-component system response regulator FixJ
MNHSQVYLIDHDRARRERLAEMLQPGQHRLWSFDSVPDFIQWLDYTRIPASACVVTHLTLAPMNGVELLDVFRADEISLPTILIGQPSELPMAVKALRYGGTYVLWDPFSAALLNEIVATMVREWRVPVAREAQQADDFAQSVEARIASLSKRQREVLREVFAGRCNRSIARVLGISIKTVELHRACMMKKMRADSLVALVRMMSNFRSALEQQA